MIPPGCSTVPGFAAGQREQAKFDADRRGRLASLSRGCMVVPTPLSLSWLRMAVGLATGQAWLLLQLAGRADAPGTPPVVVPLLP